ncbi:MAG: hypothetical protein LIO96_07915 [Lachnospiraceae bacterium]|nr:hypothetical protein [Lachnospiraceae bacterium]
MLAEKIEKLMKKGYDVHFYRFGLDFVFELRRIGNDLASTKCVKRALPIDYVDSYAFGQGEFYFRVLEVLEEELDGTAV